MLKYSFQINKKLRKPIYFIGANEERLYQLDRQYAIEKEKLKGRDLDLYDKEMTELRRNNWTKKEWLMRECADLTESFKYRKTKYLKRKIKRNLKVKFHLNEYNGYVIQVNKERYETFNNLTNEYMRECFGLLLLQ